MKIAHLLPLIAASWTGGAFAQPIAFAELEGMRIEGIVVQNRVVQTAEGKKGPNRTVMKYLVNPLPEEKVRSVLTVTVTNRVTNETNSRSFPSEAALGQPTKFRDGNAVWVFQNDSLVRLRTQEEGAIMSTFAFSRTEKGIACKMTNPFAFEVGRGNLTSGSGIGTTRAKILSVKEVSSTCTVKKS